MKQKLSAAVRSLSILSLALGSSLSFAQDNDQSADEGRALFTANQCWQCHGHEGRAAPADLGVCTQRS